MFLDIFLSNRDGLFSEYIGDITVDVNDVRCYYECIRNTFLLVWSLKIEYHL